MTVPPEAFPGRTLYHLHSLGAAGGRGFGALTAWLDHVADLGCGGVLLTPIAVSTTHGYDTVDPFHVDPRLGGDDDFTAFADACHRRDLLVVLDGVFNHVGRGFPRLTDWGRADGEDYRCFEGHRELVTLNHQHPEVLDWAAAVCGRWLDQGADGWRFDAAYAIPRPFLAELTARVLSDHPDAFLFGEVIHGPYDEIVAATGLHSVTQYELHKAIWSSLNDRNLFELAWALDRHRRFTCAFAPVTFVGNHDVTRIASQLRDPALLEAALTILFTVPGVPCVYYGDELGSRGVKEHRAGGDDEIRPALPGAPEPAAELELHHRLIAFRRERPWLTRADVEVVELANERIVFTSRVGDAAVTTTIDLAGPRPVTVVDGS